MRMDNLEYRSKNGGAVQTSHSRLHLCLDLDYSTKSMTELSNATRIGPISYTAITSVRRVPHLLSRKALHATSANPHRNSLDALMATARSRIELTAWHLVRRRTSHPLALESATSVLWLTTVVLAVNAEYDRKWERIIQKEICHRHLLPHLESLASYSPATQGSLTRPV